MSERLPLSGEQLPQIEAAVEARNNLEAIQAAGERAEHGPQQNIEAIQKSIEAQAVSGKEHTVGDTQRDQSRQTFGNSRQMKAESFDRIVRKVRTNLNMPDRTLSRIIHNKTIESVSNSAAQTIARPSALFGGSLGALLGSAALFYLSRQNGFTYNYTILLLMFIVGFCIGSIIELVVTRFSRRKS